MKALIGLFWALTVGGAGYVALPYLTPKPAYHESFSEAQQAAIERPVNVRVLILSDPGENPLQPHLFQTSVVRDYSVPAGWAREFRSQLRPMLQRQKGEQADGVRPKPLVAVRFIGSAATVDVVMCSYTHNVWFVDRGMIRPFYSKRAQDLRPLVDQATSTLPEAARKKPYARRGTEPPQ